MKVLLCLAGLVAVTFAHQNNGWNWNNGGNGGSNNGGGWNAWGGNNNNDAFWNMMMGRGGGGGHSGGNYGNNGGGHGSGWGSGQNNGGNMGQQWPWGGNQNQQGGMNGNMGGMPQLGMGGGHGVWGLVMMSIMKNLHGNNQNCGGNGRGNNGGGDGWTGGYNKDDDHMIEEWTKQEMVKEIFEVMMKQKDLKEKKDEFKEAMTYLCVYYHAAALSMRKMNETNSWTDERSERFESEVEGLDHEAIAEKLSDMRNAGETRQLFVDAGVKLAGWVCDAGTKLEAQMEKMEKKDTCEAASDKKDDSSEQERDDDWWNKK